jgi:MoaA/NifB/PqqE/SkfB family radical SAM enzyme
MSAVHEYHDFGSKLLQPDIRPHLADYVQWQRDVRAAAATGRGAPEPPPRGPLSINLDLTTACNYRCDHCCDWDILNSGIRYDEQQLRDSLAQLAADGLKSVILIGGGEPTVYPRFAEFVQFLKCDLRLQTAVVSNGGRNDRMFEAAQWLGARDWVRLSLDAGTDETFQRMHRPRQPVTLQEICAWVPRIKARQPALRVGFSFIVTWRGAQRHDAAIVENLDELPLAARLARDHDFDYISIKPFVSRDESNNSQVLNPQQSELGSDAVVRRIAAALDCARQYETGTFRIIESPNLLSLANGDTAELKRQPRRCHIQFFRQVLSPLGVFNCPAHRGQPDSRIAGRTAYCGAEQARATRDRAGELIEQFDASERCRNVTCIYNATNWMIERLIDDPAALDALPAGSGDSDCFL